jgi:hypothetical protein
LRSLVLHRRGGDFEDDTRRPRTRRSPGPTTPAPAPTGGSIGDRRPKIRPLVCAATPEDLIAARGLALLRLTLSASSDVEHISAKDVGLPPWDLPSLELLQAAVPESPDNTRYTATGVDENDRGARPEATAGQGQGDATTVEMPTHIAKIESNAKSSTLEFLVELWVRGSQRPEPFLDRLLIGGFISVGYYSLIVFCP